MITSARCLLTFLLLLAGTTVHAREVVRVPAGDGEALRTAVLTANRIGAPATLRLSGTYPAGSDEPIAVSGDIELVGGELIPGGGHRLFHVQPGARLVLSTRITGFRLLGSNDAIRPAIENRGSLIIRDSRFERNLGELQVPPCRVCSPPPQIEMIVNHASLEIDRTSFLDVRKEGVAGGLLTNLGGRAVLSRVVTAELDVSRDGSRPAPVVNRGGTVRIVNSTLGTSGVALETADGATTIVANSIVGSARSTPRCAGPVVSLGRNIAEDDSCSLDGPGDLVGVDAGLLPLRIEADRRRLPVLAPGPGSPAIDAGNGARCEFHPEDLQGTRRALDGDGDGRAACDVGAFELSERRLASGGITGVYFVPGNNTDGHYVSVLDAASGALIIWNTFDRNGNQAWVFGTGEVVNGRLLEVAAFTNEGGVLTDDGPVDADLAVPWGTLRIELDSCTRGRLVFDSSRDDFGAGAFPLRRLAKTQQLGCSQ